MAGAGAGPAGAGANLQRAEFWTESRRSGWGATTSSGRARGGRRSGGSEYGGMARGHAACGTVTGGTPSTGQRPQAARQTLRRDHMTWTSMTNWKNAIGWERQEMRNYDDAKARWQSKHRRRYKDWGRWHWPWEECHLMGKLFAGELRKWVAEQAQRDGGCFREKISQERGDSLASKLWALAKEREAADQVKRDCAPGARRAPTPGRGVHLGLRGGAAGAMEVSLSTCPPLPPFHPRTQLLPGPQHQLRPGLPQTVKAQTRTPPSASR
jgi:hypothetical protein